MKKIKIKSYHGAGWLAPILGDDFKKFTDTNTCLLKGKIEIEL